ncbi:alpha/beta hydrolase-fold protein [Alteromonas sp. CI.11.F.A3]|uniref:alpha/beta hydrolase-fold protein n=1 Tax=Alteromonas sp. CI.11.F.A3 TaxID=3079555 RepID=UPI002942F455|nr:alpha/beta hydrolase-fold protein [Alteromonas sp. CI.11.F.A3]WOI38684.1 alpha/beta hydrolase-fold protein [Alteromonas sp. CI.11.F.A3]
MKRIFIVLILMFTQHASADAVREIEERKIVSTALNEQLSLFIQLPLYYHENADYAYPVLYLLDAPVGITLNSGILDPLVGYNNAPQMIIVGVSTNDRDRDFTPTNDPKYAENSGGADTYLKFIETEVIPYVDANFRTEEYRIFSGHSFGGLLVAHAFYSAPDLFDAYFAFSPSLFWDEKLVAKSLVSFTGQQQSNHSVLYLNIGNEGNAEVKSPEGKAMLEGVEFIDTALSQHTPKGLRYKIDYFSQEPHQVTQIIGTYHAFRHLYPSWDVPYEAYLSGYDAVAAHFASLSELYGYHIVAKDWQLSDAALYELHERNNPNEALKYLHAVLKQRPENIEYMSTLALAYEKSGALPEAINTLNEISERIGEADEMYSDIAARISRISKLLSTN